MYHGPQGPSVSAYVTYQKTEVRVVIVAGVLFSSISYLVEIVFDVMNVMEETIPFYLE